jgi:hypothetical protein
MAWSQFYGTVSGRSRTEAARCGTKDSGLRVFAASKTGALVLDMHHWQGKDCFAVRLIPWCNSKFDEIPLAMGSFVEGEGSPVLRLDDKVVSTYIERQALKIMTGGRSEHSED